MLSLQETPEASAPTPELTMEEPAPLALIEPPTLIDPPAVAARPVVMAPPKASSNAAPPTAPALAPSAGAATSLMSTAPVTVAGAPAPTSAAPAPTSAVPTPASTAPAPTSAVPVPPSAALATPPMDRDFIARNQIVERYLSGRLPLKGATDFERFCRDNPEVLDELGLPERVNAGLRLLEASGKPEPWQEVKPPFWQKPQFSISLAAAVLVLGVSLWWVANDSAAKSLRITKLQSQVVERPLDPATSTREIRLLPSREGSSNTPAIMIGGGSAQLADLKIDESRSPHKVFRVTIDRIDQGRVAVISELGKDSNGHLRLALNSSALGPGSYQFTIEGLNWRGDPEPDSWITIGIQR